MSNIWRKLRKRRGLIISVVIAALGIGLLAYQLARTPEPVYGGKTVSAWIRQFSRSDDLAVRVSGSGKGGPILVLGSPRTNQVISNSSLYWPGLMQPKPGLTNIYLIDNTTTAYEVLLSLDQMGVLAVTNVRVSIGTQTNLVILPSRSNRPVVLQTGLATTPGNIYLPGPVRPAPGLNLIHVYPVSKPADTWQAIAALRAIGVPALPYLERALLQQNRPLQSVYLKLYCLLGQWAERRLPEPAADAVLTRRAASRALAQMPMLRQSSSVALVAALKDPDASVRVWTWHVLDRLSVQDPTILPAVSNAIIALRGDELLQCVEKSSSSGPASVQALIGILKQRDAHLRAEAVAGMGRIGPSADIAIPTLVLRLQDEDRTVRARTCEALARIDAAAGRQEQAEIVIPALIQALADPDDWVRRNAAESLGLYQARAKAALPRLWALRNATNGVERNCMRKALKQIDPEAAQKLGIDQTK